ncbi:MAG: hemerythrin domain-containing protein [Thermoplasmata archaeon]
MADWFTKKKEDAINIIKRDHDQLKELFEEFEKTEEPSKRRQIAKRAIEDLKIHAVIEEELFYPRVRAKVGDDTMNEADEEHHVAKVLVAELDSMGPRASHFEAKFIVLAESVRHHMKEEETEMLPKARKADLDFEEIGREMLQRKEELRTEGFPPTSEEAMVAAAPK